MNYSESAHGILREVQGAEEVAGTNTHKILWTIFFGIIFIIIFLVVYLIFTSGHKNISEKKLIEGVAMEVGESDVITFDLEKEEHGMWINFLGDGSVELTISSEPINLSLKINEIKEVDLDKDGIFDIKIKLVGIVNRKATIAIQKVEEESCQADWRCSEWLDCSRGLQKRRCEDLNSCETIFDKPSEIKSCSEIESIKNDNDFYEETDNNETNSLNKSINKSLNNNPSINLTNKTTQSNSTNLAIVNNNSEVSDYSYGSEDYVTDKSDSNNTINLTSCPQDTYFCQEDYGFFCEVYPDSGLLSSSCCPKECLKFDSKEQLCSARGYFYFEGNETYLCKVQVYSSFNGTNILCCDSIQPKVNINSGLFSKT